MTAEIPPGYEDPAVDYRGWHLSRFGFPPTPEDSQRWQKYLEGLGINEEIRERLRVQVMMRATVELAMEHANRLMSDNSSIDPTEDFTPIY